MTKNKRMPCSAWVIDSKTHERIYCEQGEDGHWGTCIGARSQEEYDRLCEEGLPDE